jgi:hypothetical protein
MGLADELRIFVESLFASFLLASLVFKATSYTAVVLAVAILI